MKLTTALPLAMTAALALAACGEVEPDERLGVAEDNTVPEPTVELQSIQLAAYERLNRDEVRTNLKGIFDGMGEGESLPPKAEMDFAALDRDSDGNLNVAEFSLWYLSPTGPELSEEQVTDVASQFFLNDIDGDSYLSETEMTAVMTGEEPVLEPTVDPAPVG